MEYDGLPFKLCIFDWISAFVLYLQVFARLIGRIIGRQITEFHGLGYQRTALAVRAGDISSEGVGDLVKLSRVPDISCHVDAVDDARHGALERGFVALIYMSCAVGSAPGAASGTGLSSHLDGIVGSLFSSR